MLILGSLRTTATVTGTSLNKRFNEHYHGCAQAFTLHCMENANDDG